MKKLLTVLLAAIIAAGTTSQTVAVQAAETSQNKAADLVPERV